MPRKPQPEFDAEIKVAVNEASVYEQEQFLRGPKPTGLTCANSNCANVKHCTKPYFVGMCELKMGYIQDLVKAVDGFLHGFLTAPPTSVSLMGVAGLHRVPTADILLDIAESDLCRDAKSTLKLFLRDGTPYVKQLALLYFTARIYRLVSKTFPKTLVLEALAEPNPFATMAGQLQALSDAELSRAGPQSTYLTKRNMIIAGTAIAVVAAGVAVAWHYGAFESAASGDKGGDGKTDGGGGKPGEDEKPGGVIGTPLTLAVIKPNYTQDYPKTLHVSAKKQWTSFSGMKLKDQKSFLAGILKDWNLDNIGDKLSMQNLNQDDVHKLLAYNITPSKDYAEAIKSTAYQSAVARYAAIPKTATK